MSRLETVNGESWVELLAAPASVLVLGRSDCAACAAWNEELDALLDTDDPWPHVRFGKLLLDQRGLQAFKRAHPWVAGICELPTNLLFLRGVKKKTWLGGGGKRLEQRLASVPRADA